MMNTINFFIIFFPKKRDEDNGNVRKKKIDELRNFEMRLYGEPIKSENFKLKDEFSVDEIEKEIENLKRASNIKDDVLRMIKRYEEKHKNISKEDFYKIFKNKVDVDTFWIIYIKNKKDNRSDDEEKTIKIKQLRDECIEIISNEKDFTDLHLKWKNFINTVNDEQYLTNLKTYAEKFLSKDKIEKIIEPMFKRHSDKIKSINDVYEKLSSGFENAEELKGSKIGREMKQEVAKIIYNKLKL